MKKYLLIPLLLLVSWRAGAQCLVNSITVNTGYDVTTGTPLAVGVHDPKWQVTGMSAACATICGCSAPYQAWTIPPLVDGIYSWATSPTSQWINFYNGTGYISTSAAYYSDTLVRSFRTCVADSFVLNFQISADNYITNMNIDGGPVLFSQPSFFDITTFTTFVSFTTTVYLTPGTHSLNISLGNEPADIPMNAHGLNIVGTISSSTGANTMVSEDPSCASYVCGTLYCNTINIPNDSAAACGGISIPLSATVAGLDSILSIRWTPSTGISDTSILNPNLTATTSGYYYCTVQSIYPSNLVVNGDFSAGNTGFSSSYTYFPPPSTVLNEGDYSVTTDPHNVHTGFTSFGDHTTGTGNMMVMNGGPTAVDVWCETITVTPNTDYDFSAWVADCSSVTVGADVPILQFKINGVLIGTPDTVTAAVGTWVNFHAVWNSGASTTANICIYDALTTASGNDFVLDDISFAPYCTAKDSIYVTVTPPDTLHNTRDTAVCPGTITLTAPAGYAPYLWSTGSTAATASVSTAGVYWVHGTAGCSVLRDTFNVSYLPAPIVNIGNDTSFCVGNSITLTALEPAGSLYLWSTGNTTNSITVSTSGTYWVRVTDGCPTTDTIHILVSPHPVVDLGPDTTSCQGQPVLLQSSVTYTLPTYLWNTGSTASSILATTNGTYWLQVTDGGCPGADTINVVIKYDTLDLYSRDTAICKGRYINALAGVNPAATCQWLPTTGISFSTSPSPVIIPDTSAMYHIYVSLPGCPVISDSFFVDVQPTPTVYAGGNRFVCGFDTIHVTASVSPNWYSGYSYSWAPGTSLDNTNTATVVFTAGITQEYTVTVSTSAGCTGVDSAQIIAYPGNFGTISPDVNICPHDSAMLLAAGGGTYHWYPSTYLSDPTIANPVAHAVTSLTYTVIVTSAVGACTDTLNVNVTVWPAGVIFLPDTSVTLHTGESYQLSPVTNCTTFNWFPPTGLNASNISNPIANPSISTMYVVTGATDKGCLAIDTIDIIVSPETVIGIPNAFTPGTGANSVLYLIKEGAATLNYYRIYNRWGNVVFETTDINKGWDGTYNGTAQPFGVYVYDIQAVTPDGKIFNKSGNVTLLR